MNRRFVRNISQMRGEEGRKWMESIPELLRIHEKRWNIHIFPPFNLTYNYVAPAEKKDGTPLVIKIGFKGDKEFLSEIEALKQFGGNGSVKLLKADIDNAVILLEKIIPGTHLSRLANNEEAVRIGIKIARTLWRKPPQKNPYLIPLEKWYNGFEKIKGNTDSKFNVLPRYIVSEGERLFAKLLATTKEKKLIHGDFHHKNILRSQKREWLAIDPKGIIGDPIYDLAVFLYNPKSQLSKNKDIAHIVKKRIEIFSDTLGFEKERIIEWGIAQSVLSSIWTIENNQEGWKYTIKFAEMLLNL